MTEYHRDDAGDDHPEPVERVDVYQRPVSEPQPPRGAPNYAVEPLGRQGAETLREVAQYALQRAAWLDREIDPEDVVDDDQDQLVDFEEDPGGKGSIVKKKIPCGKDCDGCPHGPYEYRVWREGDKVRTEYLGKPS
jgi:hypothetical protein